MRILLSIIMFCLLTLIALEDCIVALLHFLKRVVKQTATQTTTISQRLIHNGQQTTHALWTGITKRFKKKKKRKKKMLKLFSFRTKLKYFILGSLFSFLFLFLPIALFIFIQELPSPYELTLRQIPQTSKIYDRNGTLLTEIYTSQNRTLVKLTAVPKHLQQATLAIEDKNFYKHPGFDLPSIFRAFRENISNRNIQGGSTITQQLIKSSMLTPEQTISRKLKELVLAFWAERVYTKNQILEMYFNQVPYGGTAWGAEAAAETYFNKSVTELTLAESAFLAGLTAA